MRPSSCTLLLACDVETVLPPLTHIGQRGRMGRHNLGKDGLKWEESKELRCKVISRLTGRPGRSSQIADRSSERIALSLSAPLRPLFPLFLLSLTQAVKRIIGRRQIFGVPMGLCESELAAPDVHRSSKSVRQYSPTYGHALRALRVYD